MPVSEILESSSDDDDTRLNMDCRRRTDDSESLVVIISGDVGGDIGMKDIRDWRRRDIFGVDDSSWCTCAVVTQVVEGLSIEYYLVG